VHSDDMDKPISPGMKYKHYAPRQPLILIEGSVLSQTLTSRKEQRIGVIAPEPFSQDITEDVEFVTLCLKEDDYREAAKNMYVAIRKMDKSGVDICYLYRFKVNPRSEAVLNRIYRADCDVWIKGAHEIDYTDCFCVHWKYLQKSTC